MRLLLDTCVVLWWMDDPSELSKREFDLISDVSNEIVISAATAWEIEIKRMRGKLDLPDDWKSNYSIADCTWLNVTPRHTEYLRFLPPIHSDPFDRLLVAQAKAESLTILTHDKKVLAYFS